VRLAGAASLQTYGSMMLSQRQSRSTNHWHLNLHGQLAAQAKVSKHINLCALHICLYMSASRKASRIACGHDYSMRRGRGGFM
jgi:hypothetical protein